MGVSHNNILYPNFDVGSVVTDLDPDAKFLDDSAPFAECSCFSCFSVSDLLRPIHSLKRINNQSMNKREKGLYSESIRD